MPERNLTTGDVAKLTGYTARSVAKWANDGGLECDLVSGPGGERRMFSREEVETHTLSNAIPWKGEASPISSCLDQATTNGAIVQTGDDLDVVVATFQTLRTLIEAVEQSPARLSPAAASQLARATQAASSELRALRKESRDQAEFDRSMIERSEAEDLVVTSVGMIVADLDALGIRLPRLLLAALDESEVSVSDRDRAARVISETFSRASDELRSKRAGWIRNELDRELVEIEV